MCSKFAQHRGNTGEKKCPSKGKLRVCTFSRQLNKPNEGSFLFFKQEVGRHRGNKILANLIAAIVLNPSQERWRDCCNPHSGGFSLAKSKLPQAEGGSQLVGCSLLFPDQVFSVPASLKVLRWDRESANAITVLKSLSKRSLFVKARQFTSGCRSSRLHHIVHGRLMR